MKIKWIKYLTISLLFASAIAGASKDSLYEINGAVYTEFAQTNGPKPLVKKRQFEKFKLYRQMPSTQDTFYIAPEKSLSEQWLEMNKNTEYTICFDYEGKGKISTKDFTYKKTSDNCIQMNSGHLVKAGTINFKTSKKETFTFHVAVGMKLLDLRGKTHRLGYIGMNGKRINWEIVFGDSMRYETIDKVLLVDTYKVTECDFVQTFWDSIPFTYSPKAFSDGIQDLDYLSPFHKYWVDAKNRIKEKNKCDEHDLAAIQMQPYFAFLYANQRSLREGLQPVYSFDETYAQKILVNEIQGGSTEYFPDLLNRTYVKINKNANGYRLPYHDEWMALARGGTKNYEAYWANDKDSLLTSQNAWFGVRDPKDWFFRLDSNKMSDKDRLNNSCGEWRQDSRPVGMLNPNPYGLYDILGLVCETTILQRKTYFFNLLLNCKGGFLTDPFDAINVGAECKYATSWHPTFMGLRLVRELN